MISGVTVVTMLVCFTYHLHARLRAHRAPGIPCALCFEGREIHAQLGRFTPRECKGVFDECERATLSLVIARLDRATQYSRDA